MQWPWFGSWMLLGFWSFRGRKGPKGVVLVGGLFLCHLMEAWKEKIYCTCLFFLNVCLVGVIFLGVFQQTMILELRIVYFISFSWTSSTSLYGSSRPAYCSATVSQHIFSFFLHKRSLSVFLATLPLLTSLLISELLWLSWDLRSMKFSFFAVNRNLRVI